jgi:NDP-sugar pyrophosphorylase family protein
MLPVAILAGGLGRRLQPLTATIPKALVPVAGRPFVCHQLELLVSQGVERAVLCVGHLGEQIRALVGDGRRFGLQVEYSFDGPRPLGTGGALRQALSLLDEGCFVLYGDSYLTCCFDAVLTAFRRSGRPALLTVLRNGNRWDRSNARLHADGRVEYDKSADRIDMTHIDYGLAVLARSVLEAIPAGAIDLADVYRNLSRRGALASLEVTERFYEIGSAAGLADTERYLDGRPAVAASNVMAASA